MINRPRITDLLIGLAAAFFLLAVCLVGAFIVWNLGLFLYRISEVLWRSSFRLPWL